LTESEGIEMSDDQPENVAPVLRREALLPSERSRGLGTVAVVCTMAGVASGLALATTLMAMQVADSMSSRPCPYREARMPVQVDLRSDHGFLGIYYQFHDGYADVISVVPHTPAQEIGIKAGDHVLTIDHNRSHSGLEFQQRIFSSHAGAAPELVVERHGERLPTLRPTLTAWPSLITSAH
jgi:S1-C subfamily serine protease